MRRNYRFVPFGCKIATPMTPTMYLMLLIPAAYFVGSVPFGLIVGLSRGVDVRTAGSGNIGATNVGRLLGKQFFFLVFFLDMLKSLVPMAIASWIVSRIPEADRDWTLYLLWLLVGFAAVIGHMFSAFLGFKGGKGVATSAGVVAGVSVPGPSTAIDTAEAAVGAEGPDCAFFADAQQASASACVMEAPEFVSWCSPLCIGQLPSSQQSIRASAVGSQPAQTPV